MATFVSERCQACIATLKNVVTRLSDADEARVRIQHYHVNDELERFTLWVGNIGALHRPESSMSIESRLREANDVLIHILGLLDDLNEVSGELLHIVAGDRDGEVASECLDDSDGESQNEETELLGEIGACITRLFRISGVIRQAAPTDLFARALSRNRYRFNDQFDIAHVGEKYPKLSTEDLLWLRKKLGVAITQRRHYLSYIQDHRDRLEGTVTCGEKAEATAPTEQGSVRHLALANLLPDSLSRPSTFFTKASSLAPERIQPQMLSPKDESDPEDDARSYTTISRSVDGDLDASATVRIPTLDELRTGSRQEIECPFCFRIKKFKNERVWRRHVFADLRSYVCTFPDCDAAYFGDINEWFNHEMQIHRVSYICRLCQNKTFRLKDRYLAHVRKHHTGMLEDSGEKIVLDIARMPLNEIPAHECPCCSEWVDRLKERVVESPTPPDSSDQTIRVVPTVFKRHLASHLEQLALFAVPIGPAADRDVDSNIAIKDDVDTDSDLASLEFNDSRPTSPASSLPPESENSNARSEPVVEDEPPPPPTIRLVADPDLNKVGGYLPFGSITRSLSREDAIIPVGRYAKTDETPDPSREQPVDEPIMFESKVVSRKHCELSYSNGQWYIKDVGSSAGTFLNHIRLSQPGVVSQLYAINDRDRIQLGVTFQGGAEVYHRCVLIRVYCSPDVRDDSGHTSQDSDAAETDKDEAIDAPEGPAGGVPELNVITEELLKAEAGPELNENAVAMLLLDRGGANMLIEEGALAWIAEQFNREMMTLVLDQAWASVPITDKVLEAAARNEKGGTEMLELLLDRPGVEIHITEGVVRATSGVELIPDLEIYEIYITEGVVRASVGNETSGVELIRLLLGRVSARIRVTEEVVQAAAGNKANGAHVMGDLFAAGGHKIRVTPEAVVCLVNDDRWMRSPVLRTQLTLFLAISFIGDERRLENLLSRVLSIYKDRNLGQTGSAEELLSEVLDARESMRGDGAYDEVSLTVMGSLADLYANQGNLSRASDVLMQGHQDSNKAFGKDHPGILSRMLNLATLYTEQGDLERAEALFLRVIDGNANANVDATATYGLAETATAMSGLASIHANQGRWEMARGWLMKARFYVQSDHPEKLSILANQTSTYTAQEKLKDAEEVFGELMRAVHGPPLPHPNQVTSLSSRIVASTWQMGLKQMWEVQKLKGEREWALGFVERCYLNQKTILGTDHPLTQATREVLKIRHESGEDRVVDVAF